VSTNHKLAYIVCDCAYVCVQCVLCCVLCVFACLYVCKENVRRQKSVFELLCREHADLRGKTWSHTIIIKRQHLQRYTKRSDRAWPLKMHVRMSMHIDTMARMLVSTTSTHFMMDTRKLRSEDAESRTASKVRLAASPSYTVHQGEVSRIGMDFHDCAMCSKLTSRKEAVALTHFSKQTRLADKKTEGSGVDVCGSKIKRSCVGWY
jgi:hypothetical protein